MLEKACLGADSSFVLTRLRTEKGFGMLELLMAMTMLNIGILALVASFNASAVALQRAGRISTAAALADSQLELYRALTYSSIALDPTAVTNTDSAYKSDTVLGSPASIANDVTSSSGCTATQCLPTRTANGADHRRYRVDTYVTYTTLTNGRQDKLVTVVVRDATSPYRTFAREQGTFDLATGS